MIGFAERRRLAPVKVPEISAHRLPWRALHDAHGIAALVIPWLCFALLLGWTMREDIAALALSTPADASRLLQVRAWLDGQGWWDVGYFPASGSDGRPAQLSRLVDVPIAALIILLDLFLAHEVAERVAVALLPMLQLLLGLFILRSTLRCLGFRDAAANIVLLVVPLLPLVTGSMAPLRVDHHAWLAIGAIAVMRLMVDRRHIAQKTLLAGVVTAVMTAVSPESLVLAAIAAIVYGSLYVQNQDERGLVGFLAGLGLSGLLLFIATSPFEQWRDARPDALGWPHLASLALAALVASLAMRKGRSSLPASRVATVAVVALAGALPLAAAFGTPGLWAVVAGEGFSFDAGAGAMLAWMVGLFLLAIATQARKRMSSDNARGWFIAFTLAGGMLALSLLAFHFAISAQILMVPLLAGMLHDTLRTVSRFDSAVLRIVGTVLALVALSPTAGSLVGKALTVQSHGPGVSRGETGLSGCSDPQFAQSAGNRTLVEGC